MDITNPQRAKVLVHALPYIQEYSGKIVVIKYGGNAMISEKLKLQKRGKQTQFVDGLRVTDAETADVVQMVLAGKINKTLVNLIGQKGGRAIGLSGIDGQMIQARVRDERLGYVGEITKIDVRHPRRARQGLHPGRVHRRVRYAGARLQHQCRHRGRAHRG